MGRGGQGRQRRGRRPGEQGGPPAKQQRGQQTRTDIIEVARNLFSEHGYHGTGLADIQDATGLTKGAFYHHFRTKEDLALAVLETARCDYAEKLFEPVMGHGSPVERLEALLDGMVALNARPEWRNCQMLATLAAELTVRDGRLRDVVRSMQGALLDVCRDLIAEARGVGQISEAVDPETAAQWIVNTMAGSLLARKLGTARVSAEQLVTLVKRTLLGASSAPQPVENTRTTSPK